MSRLLNNLTSPYWWASVVIVGLILNVLSVYITRRLDARLSNASKWWRISSQKRKDKRLWKLTGLKESSHEQIMESFVEVRQRIRSTVFFIQGCAFGALAMVVKSLHGPKWMTIMLFCVCTITLLLGGIAFVTAVNSMILLSEARRDQSESPSPHGQ